MRTKLVRIVVPLLLAWANLQAASEARNFSLSKDIAGEDFFNNFYWWSYGDPTHGYVDYVSESEARRSNLSYVDPATGRFVMRADSTSVPTLDSPGRKSIRIHSTDLMSDGFLIAKISHMPVGCGTWPAFWTCTTQRWPVGGEIDIVEGANDQGPLNLASLHTTDGCFLKAGSAVTSSGRQTAFSGTIDKANCSNQPGCSTRFTNSPNSFGPGFNSVGGGYFAMMRDTISPSGQGIKIWFWPSTTSASNLPAAVVAAAKSTSVPRYIVNNSTQEMKSWGTPAVFFPNTPIANQTASSAGSSCDMSRYFADHDIIINLTFCGYWAGETFQYADGCPSNITCEEYVRQNPQAFVDARWEIDYLRIYQDSSARSILRASSRHLLPLALLVFLTSCLSHLLGGVHLL